MASRGVIPAPMPRPAALSLVNAAITLDLTEGEQRWELGYRFAPEACAGAWVEDPCDTQPRVVEDRPAFIEAEAFNVVAGDKCSTFGFAAEDYEGRARRLLTRQQSKQIAAELWSGALAQASGWPNQYLVESSSDTVTNGPSAVVAALACLEQALAECGSGDRGMIHATPQLVTQWAALGNSVLRREGGQLLTIHDTIIVSDGGYPGDGPGGTPAGASQWAYATGMVTVQLGAIEVSPPTFAEATDRSVNTVEFFASRPATYRWDGCCHFAAEVDLAVCLVGGAS